MRASLKIECIGGEFPMPLNSYAMNKLFIERYRHQPKAWPVPDRYWAAEITGFGPGGELTKRSLRGTKSYAESNGRGTRGVYIFYTLEEGHVYEVSEPRSWNRTDRYFCRVSSDGDIIRMTEEEVLAWPNAHSASTSTTPRSSE